MNEPPSQILDVYFFATDTGNEPVREWLKSLPIDDKKVIGTDIRTIQMGYPIGMPLLRKLAPNLWEVRSKISNGIARVIVTIDDNRMILLHGFIKKTQKTPQTDLDTAKTRLTHYKGQSNHDNQTT